MKKGSKRRKKKEARKHTKQKTPKQSPKVSLEQTNQQDTKGSSKKMSFFSFVPDWVGPIAGVIGFVSTLFSIYVIGVGERLKIIPPPGSNKEAFSAPFTLANNGYLPMRDVIASCLIDRVELEHNFVMTNNRIRPTDLPDIPADGIRTFDCRVVEALSHHPMRALVTLEVSYRSHFFIPRKAKGMFEWNALSDPPQWIEIDERRYERALGKS